MEKKRRVCTRVHQIRCAVNFCVWIDRCLWLRNGYTSMSFSLNTSLISARPGKDKYSSQIHCLRTQRSRKGVRARAQSSSIDARRRQSLASIASHICALIQGLFGFVSKRRAS
jgi:hypothetical protein